MVTESQALAAHLEKLNAKIYQVARIEGKLRARKQAALAEKNYDALQKTITREKNVINICIQGLAVASSLIGAMVDETKPLKPTKELEDLTSLLKSGLKSATAGIQIWKEEFSLWNEFLAADDAEKQEVLTQIKAKQYQRDALTTNLRQSEQLFGRIKDIQAGNIELLRGITAAFALSTGILLQGPDNTTHQLIGILLAVSGFIYLFSRLFSEKPIAEMPA